MTATGKTTVGKLVAQMLDYQFIDTDAVIEERCGAQISWIFEIEGEEKFRERESEVLRDLTKQIGMVVSTGGGIVLKEQNRMLLRRHGAVACLDCSITELLNRIKETSSRPMLNRESSVEESLVKMEEARRPLYESVADKTFSTYGDDKTQLARDIANWYRNRR